MQSWRTFIPRPSWCMEDLPIKDRMFIAELKIGVAASVALYFVAHGGDAIHLEAASGLLKATPLKYQV
jgi:hypothetical protein